MTTDWIIAIDLGGTQLRAALCTPDGTIHTRVRKMTHAKRGPDDVMARACQAAEQVWPEQGEVQAIGLSAPGPVNPLDGVVIGAPNLPGWDHVPARDILRERFQRPVYVGNDANLAALAEHRFGAGRGCDDMIYMTISTGIGGGIVLGGRLFLGHQGLAGEIGHVVVRPDGPRCGCGNRGCLEALASGTAIGHQAQTLAIAGRAPAILAAAGGDVTRVSSKSVGQAAAQGDKVAIKLLRQAGRYIGIGITNLMHLFNPQRFVLGGGVTQTGALLFRPIHRTVRLWAFLPQYWEDTEIVPAALGDDVCLLGALALASSEARGESRGERGDDELAGPQDC
jgi:glucokinase